MTNDFTDSRKMSTEATIDGFDGLFIFVHRKSHNRWTGELAVGFYIDNLLYSLDLHLRALGKRSRVVTMTNYFSHHKVSIGR